MSKAFEAASGAGVEQTAESCLIRQGRLHIDDKKLNQYKVFGVPRGIITYGFQSCWRIRSSLVRVGLTI
jgi:hypothetical protein